MISKSFEKLSQEDLESALLTLRGNFKKLNVRKVDYALFRDTVSNHFEAIPENLLERVYRGITDGSTTETIPVEDFLDIIGALFGSDRRAFTQLIFYIYDLRGAASVERVNVERVLREVYSYEYIDTQGRRWEGYNEDGAILVEDNGIAYVEKIQPQLEEMFTVSAEVRKIAGDSRTTSVTQIVNKRKSKIRLSEFRLYGSDLSFMADWILAVMSVFISTPSPRLQRTSKRYSATVETEEMVARYGESRASIDRLKQIFYARCGSSKEGLPLDSWVDWVVSYMTVDLAAALFRAKSRNFKLTWRFMDFAEFCMIFGAGTLEDKALALCKMFYTAFVNEQQQQLIDEDIARENAKKAAGTGTVTGAGLETATIDEVEMEELSADVGMEELGDGHGDDADRPPTPYEKRAQRKKLQAFLHSMRVMVLLLARACDPLQPQPEPPRFSANLSSLADHAPHSSSSGTPTSRRRSLSDVSSADIGGNHSVKRPSLQVVDMRDTEKYVCTLAMLEETTFLPAAVREALGEVEQSGREDEEVCRNPALLLQKYIDLIVNHESALPGLRELSMTSCCLFGVRPPAPHLEKEFVMEIMMRRQAEFPQTSTNPFGPEDTEWCIINKAWWDSWRFYVGKIRQPTSSSSSSSSSKSQGGGGGGGGGSGGSANGEGSPERPVPEPQSIDNWAILKRTGAKQLLSGIAMGQHLEVVPPAVYASVYAWYGGGPRIIRKVVPVLHPQPTVTSTSSQGGGNCARREPQRPVVLTELELFPLNLRVCTCDQRGRQKNDHKDYLFSKTATVAEMMAELCDHSKRIEVGKTRLWNYAKAHWKDQYILSPELTLIEAKLTDNQDILMEISTTTGAWPRSQRHADLIEEESEESGSGGGGVMTQEEEEDARVHSVSGKHLVRMNSGKVGLDNLGNTCYMNSSLQALMHTDPLVTYFLNNQHVKHVNVSNRDGHKGRLAYYFGRLSTEMWTTPKNSISPRNFISEVGYLNQNFQGHQQQDAQELMNFLMEGLSEDLNLVESKPYTEQPDSDGRPDAELADIWWANHQKRELSIVQALFAGQYKCTRRCACGYSSARYEPFTSLSVPIPDDVQRVMTVHVFTRGVSYGTMVSVIVDREGTLMDVIAAFLSPSFKPPLPGLGTGTGTGTGTHTPIFAAAEVNASKIRQTCKLTRRLQHIRESDFIFFYEVTREASVDKEVSERLKEAGRAAVADSADRPWGPGPGLEPEQEDGGDREGSMFRERELRDDDYAAGHGNGEKRSEKSSNTNSIGSAPAPASAPAPRDVKVCFVQRYASSRHRVVESFSLDIFGLPLMEVLSSTMTGAELYRIIGDRVSVYLGGRPGLVRRLQMTYGTGFEEEFGKASATYFMGPVRPMTLEEAVGGPIPPRGFVLRFIHGGETVRDGGACSECHWMSGCSGCLVPNDDTEIRLRDSQTLAIDWHMIVYAEMIDTAAIQKISRHESASQEDSLRLVPGLPLSACFAKFAETEKLEDCVCPRCLEDDKMVRHDELWRVPPVLMVQLKRFQWFPHRKKLNNKVDFPMDALDLGDYIAPSRKNPNPANPNHQPPAENPSNKHQPEPPSPGASGDVVAAGTEKVDGEEEKGEKEEEDGTADGLPLSISQPVDPSDSSLGCTVYDLYAAVHHVGALGGGHYVCTVREGSRPHLHSSVSSPAPGSRRSHGSTSSTGSTEAAAAPAADENTTSTGTGTGTGTEKEMRTSTGADSLPSNAEEKEKEGELGNRWFVYNDGQVTALQDSKEVSAASAYILFYLRRDARNMDLSELFPQADTLEVDRSKDFVFKERPSARRMIQEQASKAAGLMSTGGGYFFGRGRRDNKVRSGGERGESGDELDEERVDGRGRAGSNGSGGKEGCVLS